ncbi:MAG: hypothetical protein AB1736_15290, partial [Chloroflexota bacterium]
EPEPEPGADEGGEEPEEEVDEEAEAKLPAEERLRRAAARLPKPIRADVAELIRAAESQLAGGPIDMTIPPSQINKLATGYSGMIEGVRLTRGIINVETTFGTAQLTPGIDNDDRLFAQVKGLGPLNAKVARAFESTLKTVAEALEARGQRIAGISIEPEGITLQTEAIPPPD